MRPSLTSHIHVGSHLVRAADVLGVLVKYGLANWLADSNWELARRVFKSHGGQVLADQSFEVRVRLALLDLGTTFVKLGQMMSTRPDVVGKPLADELSKLQGSNPADPPETVLATIESELGRPADEVFKKFDPVAIASASIGQVHMARLRNNRRVVVKVQHPGIEGAVRRDLDILKTLADLADRSENLRRYQPINLARDFRKTMLGELDFRREMRNLQAFRRNFADDDMIVFPRPYPELTTGRVLTMDYFSGVKVTEEARMSTLDLDRSELARRGGGAFVEMIFRDGFYHADPHPGNILVMKGGKIGLIDAGMVGRLDETLRTQVEEMILAAGDQDAERLTEVIVRVCGTPTDLDRGALSGDLLEFFTTYGTQAVGEFNVGGAMGEVSDILHQHKLVLPSRLSLLIKCLALLEGTARLLSPDFSLAELLRPYRTEFLKRRYSPMAQLKKLGRLYRDWERLAETVPPNITEIIERVRAGHFSINMRHSGLETTVNRVVLGLLSAALLVSSALLWSNGVPPRILGVPVLGFLGYMMGMLIGLRLLWKIYHAGRHNRPN